MGNLHYIVGIGIDRVKNDVSKICDMKNSGRYIKKKTI